MNVIWLQYWGSVCILHNGSFHLELCACCLWLSYIQTICWLLPTLSLLIPEPLHLHVPCCYINFLLLARLLGQYCFACWRLSSSVLVVCNAAGGRAGHRTHGLSAASQARGRSGGRHCTVGQYSYASLGPHRPHVRSTPLSWPNNVSKMSIRPYVCPSVHKKFLWFLLNLVCR